MAPRNETVRLLVLHESRDNAEQIINALKNAGIATRPELVNDKDGLADALKEGGWDIMLAGENTNGIAYSDALLLISKQDKDLPLIVLLNTLDQEMLTECLQAGAMDAVAHDAHQHVVLAIRREVASLNARRARRRAEASLAESEKRCELLLDNSRDAIAYVHDGMHIYANAAYIELFGHESTDDVQGMPIVDLVAKEDLNNFKKYLQAYSKGESISKDLRFHGLTADGGKIDAMMQLSAASYDGEPCTQIIIRRDDGAGNAALLAEKLKEATSIDSLTGLPNRQRFEGALNEAVHKSQRDKSRHALYCINIDNLAQINSVGGLAAGDEVIKAAGTLLSAHFKDQLVARFGDAAFTVLASIQEAEAARSQADSFCQSLHNHLIQMPDGKTHQTTASVGLVMVGETSPSGAEMLTRAINTADKAKLAGGNRVDVFNAAEKADSSDSALLELLVDAIENGKFKLLYQPIVDVEGNNGEFYEVFTRLPLADGKMMMPDDFMEVAARHQIGTKIDRWVLLNAAKQLKEHRKQSPGARLLVNLTAESLQDPSLAMWVSKLSKAIDPQGTPIMVQFSDSDIVAYLKAAGEQAHSLQQAGCGISISHFGTGLNPMNTLKHVAASYIKLDRSFTEDLSNEQNMGAMRKLTQELQAQDKKIIVSFVENAQTLSKLWTLGVHYLQGYYLQPPSETMHFESQG